MFFSVEMAPDLRTLPGTPQCLPRCTSLACPPCLLCRDQLASSTFTFKEEHRERLNAILSQYQGTHNFHNFTVKVDPARCVLCGALTVSVKGAR